MDLCALAQIVVAPGLAQWRPDRARICRPVSKHSFAALARSASIAALTILSLTRTAAANDPCAGAGTVTCSGDQSGGVAAPGGTSTIIVNSLTTNIQPAAGWGIIITGSGSNGGGGVPLVDPDGGNGGGAGSFSAQFDGSRSITAPVGGIGAVSVGGSGGNGSDGITVPIPLPPFLLPIAAGDGGKGGPGGTASVTASGSILANGASFSHGIFAQSAGGNGGDGGDQLGPGFNAGTGGGASSGGLARVDSSANITTTGSDANGIRARSLGGVGGSGGTGYVSVIGGGGGGGATGNGGDVDVRSSGAVRTSGFRSYGIFAQSIGGFAGGGGDAWVTFGSGGNGNSGGDGGNVAVRLSGGSVRTSADLATGIYAQSVGGGGGAGGFSVGLVGFGGSGSIGGSGRDVTVINGDDPGTGGIEGSATIEVTGNGANGIFAQSIGGAGGDGGAAGGIVAVGGTAGAGGSSGIVRVINQGRIQMSGNGAGFGAGANAIFAQSVGGGGGAGGSTGALVAIGGNGANGGNGNQVFVNNSGRIENTCGTGCLDAGGIYAQSVGGGGGKGGSVGGLVAIGARGAAGGNGELVDVGNFGTIIVSGAVSRAIFAQSVGGGGGDGGNAGGWFSFGGAAGAGGNGGVVNVQNRGDLTTHGADSVGLLAQSVGGGGGTGGSAVAIGVFVATAFGASGGEGGDGNAVRVNDGVDANTLSNRIDTFGERSTALSATSVGGGGGSGGAAVAVSAGLFVNFGVAVGAGGGTGGNGGDVVAAFGGGIHTRGGFSRGIEAQSLGGGGGSGGFALQAGVSVGAGANIGFAMGGGGGDGGVGRSVTVRSNTFIVTDGPQSQGIFAQSVGGGGGSGGLAVTGGVQVGAGAQIGLALGGTGGGGGESGIVNVTHRGDIVTGGFNSQGIFAQSVGGGGGSGGASVSAGVQIGAGASANFAIGGKGGPGGSGNAVTVRDETGVIRTTGQFAHGIQAQSVGGGGGNGGLAVAAGFTLNGLAANLSFGGSGGSAGEGRAVSVFSRGGIETRGANANGIFAQSVGGGGGAGGFAVSGSFAVNGAAAALAFGGRGGGGGEAKDVSVDAANGIQTFSDNANGILAQSVGGGGGNAGFAVGAAGGLGFGNVGFGMGGAGGVGGSGGNVRVDSSQVIETRGKNASGILAQSIGGGGGNGGFAIGAAIGKGVNVGLAFGGEGAGGSIGRNVTVNQFGNVTTIGDLSHGIFAQSVGGGGGNGGFAVGGAASLGDFAGSLSMGGTGGAGANSGQVRVFSIADISTGQSLLTFGPGGFGASAPTGHGANAIQAQSIGGGGGSGGFSISAAAAQGYAVGVGLGGKGGGGGNAEFVSVTSFGRLDTIGDNANGILAQSVGGGGGNAGFAIAGALTLNKDAAGVSFGGKGGTAGDGRGVEVFSSGNISTGNPIGFLSPGTADSRREFQRDPRAVGRRRRRQWRVFRGNRARKGRFAVHQLRRRGRWRRVGRHCQSHELRAAPDAGAERQWHPCPVHRRRRRQWRLFGHGVRLFGRQLKPPDRRTEGRQRRRRGGARRVRRHCDGRLFWKHFHARRAFLRHPCPVRRRRRRQWRLRRGRRLLARQRGQCERGRRRGRSRRQRRCGACDLGSGLQPDCDARRGLRRRAGPVNRRRRRQWRVRRRAFHRAGRQSK